MCMLFMLIVFVFVFTTVSDAPWNTARIRTFIIHSRFDIRKRSWSCCHRRCCFVRTQKLYLFILSMFLKHFFGYSIRMSHNVEKRMFSIQISVLFCVRYYIDCCLDLEKLKQISFWIVCNLCWFQKTDLIGQWLFYPAPYAQYQLPRGLSHSIYSQNLHIIWAICILDIPDIPNYSQYCSKIYEFLNILKYSQIFICFGFCVKPLANCMKNCFFFNEILRI